MKEQIKRGEQTLYELDQSDTLPWGAVRAIALQAGMPPITDKNGNLLEKTSMVGKERFSESELLQLQDMASLLAENSSNVTGEQVAKLMIPLLEEVLFLRDFAHEMYQVVGQISYRENEEMTDNEEKLLDYVDAVAMGSIMERESILPFSLQEDN